jgi:S-adenosylmethionine decarboxylase
MLDLLDCPEEKLGDEVFITKFLERFPGEIQMQKISPPYVFRWEEGEDKGISGVVLIAESHITIHTFPARKMAFVDVFSTKEFDLAFVSNYLVNYFEAQKHEVSKITA